MIISFSLLTMLDYISTLLVITAGGLELNPIAAAIAFEGENPTLYGFIYKLFTVLLILFVYSIFKRKDMLNSFTRIMVLVNLALLLAIVNNFFWVLYLYHL